MGIGLRVKHEVLLTEADSSALEKPARAKRRSQSSIIREALAEWLTYAKRRKQPFLKRAPPDSRLARQIPRPRRSGLREYAAPDRGRELFPRRKHKFTTMSMSPRDDLIEEMDRFGAEELLFLTRSATVAMLVALGLKESSRERGKSRVPT